MTHDHTRALARIRTADAADADALAGLINAAFVVERFFKAGNRTSPAAVRSLMATGAILVADDATGAPAGSVFVEIRGDRAAIGMVSVDPSRQRRGLGRALMAAAERHARAHGCVAADISIVNLREELPPFYRRLGYEEAGTAPFDPKEPTTRECHFTLMAKTL